MGPWNVHIHLCLCVSDCMYVNMYDTTVSKIVSTSSSMIPPDPVPLSPSTSAHMKTPDPQPPNPSASLIETEQTLKRQEVTHDGTKLAAV